MIKVAFVYKPENYFLTPNHFDLNFYYFFMKRLTEHPELNVRYYPSSDSFDCKDIKDIDVLLLYDLHSKFTPSLFNMDSVKGVKLAMSGDAHNCGDILGIIQDYGIHHFFFTNTSDYFYRFFPSEYTYRQIIIGLNEGKGYYKSCPIPWNKRNQCILNAGALNPIHHKLRIQCNTSEYVTYIPKTEQSVGDNFVSVLHEHRASIAAADECFTLRCIEVPAAECLSFIQINGRNGADLIGFEDGVSAVLIDESNYEQRFSEYFDTYDDPKWERIAVAGREFVASRYTNLHGVNSLVEYMKELI